MKKLQIGYVTIIRLLAILCLCCSCLVFSSMAEAAIESQQSTVTMSMNDYKMLKETLQKQEATLLLLKTRYQELKLPSKELAKQLAEAENQLKKSKEELAKAKNSLMSASATIEKLKLSLTELEKAIDQERAKARLTKMQRDAWCVIAILFGVVAIYK